MGTFHILYFHMVIESVNCVQLRTKRKYGNFEIKNPNLYGWNSNVSAVINADYYFNLYLFWSTDEYLQFSEF